MVVMLIEAFVMHFFHPHLYPPSFINRPPSQSLFKTKLASSDFPITPVPVQNEAHHRIPQSLFKTKLASSDFPAREEDILVLLTATLKMADAAWCCRPLQTMLRWSGNLHDEFFRQGDVEKALPDFGPPSPFCDRDSTETSKVTLGFIFIVQPLISAYAVFLNNPTMQKTLIQDGLEANRAYLQSWVS